MSDTQQTQTDPLIALVAQQSALQLQIDRLMAQRTTPLPATAGRQNPATASASASPSQRISAMERLGSRRRRQASRGHSKKISSGRTDGENELSSEGESEKTVPSPHQRDQQVNLVRVAHSGASVRKKAREGRGRPPLPPNRAESVARTSVFDRISPKTSVEEIEKRLRLEMKNQMAEFFKQAGGSGGVGSSAAALLRDSESPFAQDIQTCPVPGKFKLPTLESYDGKTDPVDHWQQYGNIMSLQDVPDGIMCRGFVTTLKGSARMWCNNLPPNSIRSFQELGAKFIAHFLGTRKHSKPSSHLFTVQQKSSESLKDYASRFNQESLMISGLNDGVAVAAFMQGVTSPLCLMTLARTTPKSMSELLDEVDKQVGVEEALQGRNVSALSALLPSSKRQGNDNSSPNREREGKKSKKSEYKASPSEERRKRQFTPLTAPLGEVYAQIETGLPEPRKMKTPNRKRDNSKFCRYHKDHGHETNDCWKLKEEIEKLIQRGQLRQYVDKNKPATQEPKGKGKDLANEIFMIEGGSSFSGDSNRSRKAHIRRAQLPSTEVDVFSFRPAKMPKYEVTEITFTDEDMEGVEHPHDDPLVVTAMVGNHNVHRILIDTGATSNLMYYSALKAMGLTIEHLIPSSVTLVGFSGEKTKSLGTIKLSVTLGTAPKQVTTIAEFLVLDKTPNYNAILGRGTLNKIKAAISTCSLTIRFPTPHGIGEVRGNQVEARYCHFGVLKEVRSVDVATMEVEVFPPLGTTISQELPDTEKLEVDTLDPRDEEKELRGKPVEDL